MNRVRKADGNSRGFALILTLSAVVLISTLILAFFSRAILNARIAYSSSNQIKTDILCRASMDIICGELREELRTGSTTLDGGNATYPVIYKPLAAANLVPLKMGVSSPNTVGAATILKVSAANTAINPNPGGKVLGSSLSTSVTSLNGRYLSSSIWFGTADNTGPCLGSQGTLPNWVFLSRGNGVTMTPTYNAARTDPNFVIGRFAYVVYDLGGLLNANAVGYHSGAGAEAPYKSSTAYADLTQIPGVTAPDTFVLWRNGNDAATVSTYNNYLQNYALKNGFLATKIGNNAFFSRQDLIHFAQNGSYGLSATSLGYLTQFSRSLNAPSWSPIKPIDSTIDYAAAAENTTSANRNIPNVRFSASKTVTHYNDDGTTETYSVVAGDSLLQRRFSLAKLAWLTYEGPVTGKAGAIQACFGLQWNSGQSRWDYVGSSGNTLQTAIKTLDEVAQDNREPNFVELLKAGILSGSVGLFSPATAPFAGALQTTIEKNTDLHILRIAANIIDCADNDNYPTLIALTASSVAFEVGGTEDLPYFYDIDMAAFNQLNAAATQLLKSDLLWVPVFFNPHRPSPVAVGPSPTSVTAAIAQGTLSTVSYGGTAPIVTANLSLSTIAPVTIPDTTFSSFRANPSPMISVGASNAIGQLPGVKDYASAGTSGFDRNVLAFPIFSWENQYTPWPITKPATLAIRGVFRNLQVRLQYLSSSGQMKTYATLGGYDNLSSGTSIQFDANTSGNNNNNFNSSFFLANWDPRTSRLGPCFGYVRRGLKTLPDLTGSTGNAIQSQKPFNPVPSSGLLFALWPQGGKALDTDYKNAADPDGVFRPADGYLGNSANLYRQTSGTGLNTTDQSRPVILQRPFKSVAELGYVFRDSPWKTLNFFDENSGDGALLDLFSVSDEAPITAHRMNLNSRQSLSHQALFSGAGQNADGTSLLSSPNATSVAAAYAAYAYSGDVPTTTFSANIAQVAQFISGNQTQLTGAGFDNIKWHREAVSRALAGSTESRTWNLLIDVIAQIGRYPANARNTNDFNVEGEKRYWLSIAIDRYTGKILSSQMEPVYQ